MEVTPEISRFIDYIAEAKMHLMLLAHGTRRGSEERRKALEDLERTTAAARRYLDEHGGLESLPHHLGVEMRACEMAVDKFTAQEREGSN